MSLKKNEVALYKQILTTIFIILATITAGAFSVLGFAPFGYYLLPVLALLWLLWLWRDTSPGLAFFYGWLFGLGFMGFGVFWLRISISQFGGVDSTMATSATLGFVTFIAVYFGLAGWLGCLVSPRASSRLMLTLPAAWGLMEWLRGWLFTGFPWLSLGYSQIDSPLRGYAPLFGVYGVSWILVASAGLVLFGINYWHQQRKQSLPHPLPPPLDRRGGKKLLSHPLPPPLDRRGGEKLLHHLLPPPPVKSVEMRIVGVAVGAVMLIWGTGELLAWQHWTIPKGEPFVVSLIQPSIPQSMKWDPALMEPTLKTYHRLTATAPGTLIVWPETAVPHFLHKVEATWLLPLAEKLAKRHANLLVGAPILDPDHKHYHNGAALIGKKDAMYYKRHLVPFGEYLPLRYWLDPILKFLTIPMSNFTPGTAVTPNITIGNHTVGMSICYEDAFGEEVQQALPAAEYLVNLSNDAWFGNSLAPHQHLEISRMRALETGRNLVRATNSGISAVIDHQGKVRAASQLFTETVLSAAVQPRSGTTYFVYWGNNAALVLMWLCLIVGIGRNAIKLV